MTPLEALYDLGKEKLHTYKIEYTNMFGQIITPTSVEMQNEKVGKIAIYPTQKNVLISIYTTRRDDTI